MAKKFYVCACQENETGIFDHQVIFECDDVKEAYFAVRSLNKYIDDLDGRFVDEKIVDYFFEVHTEYWLDRFEAGIHTDGDSIRDYHEIMGLLIE